MKIFYLSFLFAPACMLISFNAFSLEWKSECVGYYQLALPDNLEVALYQIEDFVDPRKQFKYVGPKIRFEKKTVIALDDTAQSQYSEFYYGQYKLGISSQSRTPVNWSDYRSKVIADRDVWVKGVREYQKGNLERFNESATAAESEFKRKYNYIIKDYTDAFALYDNRGYSLTVKRDERLYHFWKKNHKDTGDKSQAAEKELLESEPEVLSLVNRFQSRKLYQVPTAQGFCMPYGFIAGDSGHELRNMGVTYRLKNHPDVTIFFQDLGMEPGPGFQRPENESAKDFVTYLWNRKYQWSSVSKELISPKWRPIKMDGRDGLGTFVKATFRDVPVYDYKDKVIDHLNYINYGYVAYVQGNHNARNLEPDLLLYVMQDSSQVKKQPPMDKDDLEKLAEHIVSSIKRR
ncbi:T6SS immunity protein Tli4 family protein [Enterobacter wuhouensis]|uniref:T6SS immunity protein Tli4 family protein n=1 Tax=Enterobacter wuhouensis TaxID=2529381 RepID=UPI002FD12166